LVISKIENIYQVLEKFWGKHQTGAIESEMEQLRIENEAQSKQGSYSSLIKVPSLRRALIVSIV
jgi:hypothetical protein